MEKIVILQLAVRVDASVDDNEVALQIQDALDPDSWNWDVGYPDVVASRPAPEDDEDEDEDDSDLMSALSALRLRQHGEKLSLAMHQLAERREFG